MKKAQRRLFSWSQVTRRRGHSILRCHGSVGFCTCIYVSSRQLKRICQRHPIHHAAPSQAPADRLVDQLVLRVDNPDQAKNPITPSIIELPRHPPPASTELLAALPILRWSAWYPIDLDRSEGEPLSPALPFASLGPPPYLHTRKVGYASPTSELVAVLSTPPPSRGTWEFALVSVPFDSSLSQPDTLPSLPYLPKHFKVTKQLQFPVPDFPLGFFRYDRPQTLSQPTRTSA